MMSADPRRTHPRCVPGGEAAHLYDDDWGLTGALGGLVLTPCRKNPWIQPPAPHTVGANSALILLLSSLMSCIIPIRTALTDPLPPGHRSEIPRNSGGSFAGRGTPHPPDSLAISAVGSLSLPWSTQPRMSASQGQGLTFLFCALPLGQKCAWEGRHSEC